MTTLFILNDQPYGSERVYNALRLAGNLQRVAEHHEVVVFLMGDAAPAAKAGQATPNGYYNIGHMLGGILHRNGRVLVCGTCMDARGLTQPELVPGATRSSMDELTELTLSAERVLVF